MIVEWENLRIRSKDSGYVIERKVPSRWLHVNQYDSLAQAAQGLLEYRIRTETTEHIINATLHASARISTAKLIKHIATMTDEIMHGLSDGGQSK